jgi:hypothetical protein
VTTTYTLLPISDAGAGVRESPSARSPERWFFPAGQSAIVLRNSDAISTDNETWWYVYHAGKSGWIRDSDVRMSAVDVSATELANTIYASVSDDLLANMLK